MNHPESPCRKDCPDRTAVCRLSCPKQRAYEKEMEAYRGWKDRELRGKRDYGDHIRRLTEKRRRHSLHKKG